MTPDDFDTQECANQEQAAVVKDEEDCMPDGLTVDQRNFMLRKQ